MQEVTGIEMANGPRGGLRWRLTLACGHTATRPITPAPVVGGMLRASRVRLMAPGKVKCRRCLLFARLGYGPS